MPGQANYSGAPQVFSGARARFSVDGHIMAYASSVSGEETIEYQPVDCLDLLEIKEHVPVAYRASLNAVMFRVINKSLKGIGIFPSMEKIITSTGMSALIEDAEPVSGGVKTMAKFTGVRMAGHSWETGARGIVSENVPFVAIKVEDESQNA